MRPSAKSLQPTLRFPTALLGNYRHLGKEKKLSFGAFPEVTLKDARAKRDEARAMIADGQDRVAFVPAGADPKELGALLKAIDEYRGYPSTLGALRISPHLFQRSGEIRTMRWEDLDLDAGRWAIPAAEMKMRRPHEVPLSRQVIEIIQSMAIVARGSEFVFPAYHNPKLPTSENAINQALRRTGYGGIMTAHGFRSTASSLLNESNLWSPDAIERALAHQDGNAVRAVHNRSAYWRDRVEMMPWWSNHLDALKAAP